MADMFYDTDGTLRHEQVNPTPPRGEPGKVFKWLFIGTGRGFDADGHYIGKDGRAYRDYYTYLRVQRMEGHHKGNRGNYFGAPNYAEYKRRHAWYTTIICLALIPLFSQGPRFGVNVSLFWQGLLIWLVFACGPLWFAYFTYTLPVGKDYYEKGATHALVKGLAINGATLATEHLLNRHNQHSIAAQQALIQQTGQPTPQQIAQQQADILAQAMNNAQKPGWVPTWE